MKILHVISSLDPKTGGVAQALRTMIVGLEDAGHENEVVSIDDPDADYIRDENFTIHALGPGKTAWQFSFKLLNWLKPGIGQFDAVITHGLWQYHTFALYLAWNSARSNKPRLFVMPHGMLDPYFQRAKGRRLKAIRNWFFWRFFERRLVNAASGILFTCESEKLLARKTFSPYHPNRELVVGLGVESPPAYEDRMKTAFESRLPYPIDSYLLFISRIHEKKGVDILIKAYQDLCSRHSKDSIPSLVIAGPGLETDFGKGLLKFASTNSDIHFTGMLSGDAKWGAFYGAQAFILPSHQENFGIAVVESLACARPVLISDQVNIWKEIEDEGAGLIFKDTLDGTTKALIAWCSLSKEQKEVHSYNASQLFSKRFSIKEATKALVISIDS